MFPFIWNARLGKISEGKTNHNNGCLRTDEIRINWCKEFEGSGGWWMKSYYHWTGLHKKSPLSMRLARGLWPKEKEGKGVPEVKETAVTVSGGHKSKWCCLVAHWGVWIRDSSDFGS